MYFLFRSGSGPAPSLSGERNKNVITIKNKRENGAGEL
jgi:hypothetical protein